jgi:hypothetical protein
MDDKSFFLGMLAGISVCVIGIIAAKISDGKHKRKHPAERTESTAEKPPKENNGGSFSPPAGEVIGGVKEAGGGISGGVKESDNL